MHFSTNFLVLLAVGAVANAVPEAAVKDIAARNAEAEPGIAAVLGLTKAAKGVSAFAASGAKLQAAGNVAPAKIASTVGNAQALRLGNALPEFKGIPIGSVRTRPMPRDAQPEAEPGIAAVLGLTKAAKGVSAFAASGAKLQAAGNVAPAKIASTVGNAQALRLGNALPAFKGIPIGSMRTRPIPREADAEPELKVAQAFRA